MTKGSQKKQGKQSEKFAKPVFHNNDTVQACQNLNKKTSACMWPVQKNGNYNL